MFIRVLKNINKPKTVSGCFSVLFKFYFRAPETKLK